MSGQWEVVGKKKGKDNKLLNKQNIKDTKKNVLHGPKIEEVLPASQVKNLYATAGKSNKENAKPVEKPKHDNKKPAKKPDRTPEPVKIKPKSIENALNSINIEEFKNIFENNKKLFPDSPLVWLKELTQFLNQKVNVDIQDHIFSSKPENYPFSVVPHAIKSVIEKAVKEAGKTNAQTFFNITLTSMATDMGKGLPVMGHKLFLQYISLYEPKFATASLNKHITLRNSYQNQQAIGLSILWALGQCGIKDLHCGLKVFHEAMLPMVELKNYSRYVIKYLIDLIKWHESESISKEQYLLILDVAFANFKNFPADLRPNLNKTIQSARHMLLSSSKNENCSNIMEPFLKKLLSNNNVGYKREICDILVNSLIKDPSSFNEWNKCFIKNIQASAVLLSYIDENWKKIFNNLNKGKLLNLLHSFTEIIDDLKANRKKEDGLQESAAAIKVIWIVTTNEFE